MNQREQRQWQATLDGKITATARAEKAEARVAELEAICSELSKRNGDLEAAMNRYSEDEILNPRPKPTA